MLSAAIFCSLESEVDTNKEHLDNKTDESSDLLPSAPLTKYSAIDINGADSNL
jgi:hypothetical protein